MKQIEDNVIEYKGNAYSLIKIYDKIMGCPDFKVTCSMKREDIVPDFVTDPIARFIKEKGTCLVKDTSKYKIQFKKLD